MRSTRPEIPGTDPAIRERLERELTEFGPAPLYARLRAADPTAAQGILPGNGRRIVRALEVIELTGAPFTASLPEPTPYYPSVQVGVDLDTVLLDERITAATIAGLALILGGSYLAAGGTAAAAPEPLPARDPGGERLVAENTIR